MNTPTLHTQRGVGTVAIALLMVCAILLSVAFAHRSVLLEVKISGHQLHAALAHEAAETGLDWAAAQLNSETLVGPDCLPSESPSGTSLRERAASGFSATCIQREGGWSCACPAPGQAEPGGLADGLVAFRVEVAASEQPGLLQLRSVACHGLAPACLGSVDDTATRAQVQVLLGRLPGLGTLPAAALTVRGTPRFDTPALTQAFGLHHTSARSGGLTLHSGGRADAPLIHVVSSPGTPPSASLLAPDAALGALSEQGLFASVFRLSKSAWRAQPSVRELSCESACDAELSRTRHTLWWLRGGLRLDTPLTLGTPEQPVLLVVDGPVQLNARVTIHGVIYGTHPTWADTAGAALHGAVLIESDLVATGATQIHHDSAVLAALHERSGSHVRVPGSWRDL